jgi:hypothetical protein
MDRDLEDFRSFPPLGPAIEVLMVWPRFPASFWSLAEVMEIVPERSLVPPLGLITVATLCPKQWKIRLVDLAFEELSDEDILWADLVMVSAMAVQRERRAPNARTCFQAESANHDRRPLCQQRTGGVTAAG